MFRLGKEWLLSRIGLGLPFFASFFLSLEVTVQGECRANRDDRQQLQSLGHGRLLSTWMPNTRSKIPVKRTKQRVNQLVLLPSNSSYKGAKTSTRVPASLSASPIISSVYFFSANRHPLGEDQRTCDCATLCGFGQFLLFQIVRMNQLKHRIAKQERILTGGWPIQAVLWLEWGFAAGPSLPAALSRFRAAHSHSISTLPAQPVAYWRKLLHSPSSARWRNPRFIRF
jgi:hypothetical protein